MQTIQNGVKPVCGTLLWMGERRKIAVYLRNSVPWVADFTDGRGELYAPGEWFSLNGGGRALDRAQRRIGSGAISPLTVELAERIERLHRSMETKHRRSSARWSPVTFLARFRDALGGIGGDRRARSGKSHRPNSTEGGAYGNYRRQVPILLPWTRANSGDC